MQLRSDIRVTLLDHAGSDLGIAEAAWVAAPGDDDRDRSPEAVGRVIKAMMKGRHGSPFEQGWLRFHVEAPIFVFREWMRHRIGHSFNEVSGRYRVLPPVFWVPSDTRPLIEGESFKPMRPNHSEATEEQKAVTRRLMTVAYQSAVDAYDAMVADGIAREVARAVLPVGTYSAMHLAVNPRSLMAFLSLRTRDARAAVPSFPQLEIAEGAVQLEAHFARLFPLTYAAFNDAGRVGP